MKTMKISVVAIAALVFGLTSCEKDKTDELVPAVSKTDSIRVSMNMRGGPYTLYSFAEGKVVPNSDSATTKWDFGARFVNIIVNSMASGPGSTGVITEKGSFDAYSTAPESGYVKDSTDSKKAIDAGLNTGWYNYDGATHDFDPKAGVFFVFKTNDNKYVKMEVLSARYEPFQGQMPEYVWYKFRYVYQPDGSRSFE